MYISSFSQSKETKQKSKKTYTHNNNTTTNNTTNNRSSSGGGGGGGRSCGGDVDCSGSVDNGRDITVLEWSSGSDKGSASGWVRRNTTVRVGVESRRTKNNSSSTRSTAATTGFCGRAIVLVAFAPPATTCYDDRRAFCQDDAAKGERAADVATSHNRT